MNSFTLEDFRSLAPILSVIIALSSIIVTIIVAYVVNWWRLRKNLSFEIKTNSSLISVNKKIKDDIEILYKGQPVKDVRMYIIKVINTGKQPIETKDFAKNLDFIFSEDSKILTLEIENEDPDNLYISSRQSDNLISIEPLMLNPKDSFELKIKVQTIFDSLKCDARIAGIREVKLLKTQKKDDRVLIRIILLLFAFGGNAILIIATSPKTPFEATTASIYLLLTLLLAQLGTGAYLGVSLVEYFMVKKERKS